MHNLLYGGRKELASREAAAVQGQAGVEAKLGALTNRLLHMARKEAKREKRRGEISFFKLSQFRGISHAFAHKPITDGL